MKTFEEMVIDSYKNSIRQINQVISLEVSDLFDKIAGRGHAQYRFRPDTDSHIEFILGITSVFDKNKIIISCAITDHLGRYGDRNIGEIYDIVKVTDTESIIQLNTISFNGIELLIDIQEAINNRFNTLSEKSVIAALREIGFENNDESSYTLTGLDENFRLVIKKK